MDKLALYTYVDGVNDTPFPDAEEQLVLNEFTYTANRMGGAPTISATAMHSKCLDNLWSDKVYASFRGEKLYVMNTPSSSKDNSDARYKHEVEFLSEREVLNHVYFIDAVQGDSSVDVYKSNTSKVIFMGDIREFGKRLQACFDCMNLGYTVEFDETAISDEKLVSFEDKYILEALQEMYNLYEIPYYFKGKTLHIGSISDYAISTPFEYGSKEALISVSKENANYAVINKIKGQGSSDNIPLYYPNTSAKGEIGIQYYDWNGIVEDSKASVTISDMDVFTEKVDLGDIYRYHLPTVSNVTTEVYKDGVKLEYEPDGISVNPETFADSYNFKIKFTFNGSGAVSVRFLATGIGMSMNPIPTVVKDEDWSVSDNVSIDKDKSGIAVDGSDYILNIYILNSGKSEVTLDVLSYVLYSAGENGSWKPNISVTPTTEGRFYNESTKEFVTLSDIGIGAVNNPFDGFGFSQEKVGWITPMTNLMPSIYRESKGAEQFYEAKNNTYEIPDGEGYYEFVNEFSKNNQRQGTTDFEDIKPTIVGITNASGQRIDMFTAFAFDKNDNDEVDDEGNYLHPYFFAKLRKFDGENGFNLFNQAIESQTMQISFTSGVCGACTFEIGSGENKKENIVQVDDNGNLLCDKEGDVRCGRDGKPKESPQDRQNDTINYEVWIALKKEDSTYGQVMPNATQRLKPSTSDTFVILGISLPQAYILAAEKKLEESLIKAMWESNKEKFNFTIKPSRIYIKEHEEELDKMLNENSTVIVRYDGVDYSMYVNSYSYKVDENNSLPEIELTVSDTLSQGSNSLQTQLDAIREDILTYIGSTDFLKQGIKYFLRKDVSDKARGVISFLKGINLGLGTYNITEEGVAKLLSIILSSGIETDNFSTGALGTGLCLKKDENGDSYLEVDRMLVRKVATFIELLIQKLRYVGGQIILTPASMSCSKVEDKGAFYRCYFQTDNGEKSISQEFVVGDQARSQTFNIKEGVYDNVSNTYYWRLVVGVGDNYIDLSKTDCDSGSTVPQAGDDIVQLGNRTEADRQSAIVLASYGNDAPYIKLYRGINSYVLDGKEFVTISRSEVNIIADSLKFSTGENIKVVLNQAIENAASAQAAAEKAQEDADAANSELGMIASDNYITPSEKTSLKQQQADIQAERNEIISNATRYGVSTTAYSTAYTAANNALTKYTASSPQNIQVGKDYANISAYYAARKTILDAIATAAKKLVTDLDNDLQGYKSEVTQKFEAVDGRFTSAITETKFYTDNAVGNIQVGGRNYIRNSAFADTSRWGANGVTIAVDESNKRNSSNSLKITQNTASDSGLKTIRIYQNATKLSTASLSFWAKADKTASLRIRLGSNQSDAKTVTLTTSWQRFVFENVTPESNAVIFGTLISCTWWLSEPMLVEGTKASDWSPAPEDTATKIEENSSKIEQLPDQISLTVNQKIENIQVGGRNLARETSREWCTPLALTNGTNQCLGGFSNKIYLDTLKVGDEVVISFDYKWSNFVYGSNASINFQGSGNVTQWDGGRPTTLSFRDQITGESGEKHISYVQKITTDDLKNQYWFVNIRHDYIKGSVTVRNFKAEKGNKATTWSPAPEDVDTNIETLSSEIKQTANSISLKVNQSIGGENLIDNSSFSENIKGWNLNGDSGNIAASIVNTTALGSCLSLFTKQTYAGLFRAISEQYNGYVEEGSVFTISFDLYKTSSTPTQLEVGFEDGGQSEGNTINIQNHPLNTWKRVSLTQTLKTSRRNVVIYSLTSSASTVYIKNFKVERGSKATEWTPSDNDRLLSTGIDILNKNIILTADNTLIQDNSGNQIAMFTTENGKPLLSAGNIDVKNLKVKHLDSADGYFKGKITADGAVIGGFTLQNNIMKSNAEGAGMSFSNGAMSNLFLNRKYTQTITVDNGINNYNPVEKELTIRTNRTCNMNIPGVGTYWFIADVMNLQYKNLVNSGRYGLQYAMLGSGHVVQDGVVDGGCWYSPNFTTNNQVHIITPFDEGNRICVTTNYTGSVLVLPSLDKLLQMLGWTVVTRVGIQFSFNLIIVNASSTSINIIGKADFTVGDVTFNFDQYPTFYNSSGNLMDSKGDYTIGSHRAKQFILTYDGTNYNAFEL